MKNCRHKLTLLGLVIGAFCIAGCAVTELKIKSSAYREDVTAYLYTPSGEGPFPAVIVLHTKAGIRSHVLDFASALSRKGYVTLTVDYYRNRSENIVDAYDHLKNLTMVDPNRIGMVGFSLGSYKAFDFVLDNPGRKIRAIVNYYAGGWFWEFGRSEYPPTLFLHGDLDDSSSLVKPFCEDQKKIARLCEVHLYEGVGHGFDTHSPKYDFDGFATADAFKRSLVFLDKHVKVKSK